ncbi:hypothetical protein EHQ53_11110 [Leptospira langatensis]|uniref:DUF1640 domain-containing protein n=1 Tax=Leptospira langatensis TaxID=2484983 RepID=A0A5F1ZSE9_9LEPT|nr:hypothetical protein [Leptospira langatensis]TGJ98899.1 hypothetical protein EHO57_15390 [Leptospira langatensis]TGL40534.1 hypothetical protein EHQ53_11110 [Leptospira langatensis]
MGLEILPRPSKKLRATLGQEATENLEEYVQKMTRFENKTMTELLFEKFERRILEEVGKVRKEIHSQTKWVLAAIFGAVPFYMAIYKLFG